MNGQPWTEPELELLRAKYPTSSAAALAEELGRTIYSIRGAIHDHGLRKQSKVVVDAAFLASLRGLNRAGFPDTGIADKLRCERHAVSKHRKRLGLPCRMYATRVRRKIAEGVKRQCEAAGVTNMAELRSQSYRRFATRNGWPEGTRPREVMILNALDALGPLTRRQIAEAIGMPWRGSRMSLKAPCGRGSYLANLMARGLVVSLGRIVKGKGLGRSVYLYSLATTTMRGNHEDELEVVPVAHS